MGHVIYLFMSPHIHKQRSSSDCGWCESSKKLKISCHNEHKLYDVIMGCCSAVLQLPTLLLKSQGSDEKFLWTCVRLWVCIVCVCVCVCIRKKRKKKKILLFLNNKTISGRRHGNSLMFMPLYVIFICLFSVFLSFGSLLL